MHFAFTEEQEELRSQAHGFLGEFSASEQVRKAMESEMGYDPELWGRISAELGWPSVRGNHEDYLLTFRRGEVPPDWLEADEGHLIVLYYKYLCALAPLAQVRLALASLAQVRARSLRSRKCVRARFARANNR